MSSLENTTSNPDPAAEAVFLNASTQAEKPILPPDMENPVPLGRVSLLGAQSYQEVLLSVHELYKKYGEIRQWATDSGDVVIFITQEAYEAYQAIEAN